MLISLRSNSCQYNRYTGSRGNESCEGYTMKQVFLDQTRMDQSQYQHAHLQM